MGHTALLRGATTKDGVTTTFVAVIDSPEDRQLVGAPFELEVAETSDEKLGLRLLTADSHSGASLFDELDFAAIDTDGDGDIRLDEASVEPAAVDAYNTLRRAFQTHDFFDMRPLAATR